jgi:hypothetical protein
MRRVTKRFTRHPSRRATYVLSSGRSVVGVARRTISGRWEVLGQPDRSGRRVVLARAQRLGRALELAGMEATS